MKLLRMISLTPTEVENEILNVVEDIRQNLRLKDEVNIDLCPGLTIKSHILLTAIDRIGEALGVVVPDNCYIFYDKKNQKQLSIKEAALKLIKEAKYGS